MTSDFEGAVAKSTNVYIVVKQGFEVPVHPVHSVYDHCECDQMFWSFRTESDHEDLVVGPRLYQFPLVRMENIYESGGLFGGGVSYARITISVVWEKNPAILTEVRLRSFTNRVKTETK